MQYKNEQHLQQGSSDGRKVAESRNDLSREKVCSGGVTLWNGQRHNREYVVIAATRDTRAKDFTIFTH